MSQQPAALVIGDVMMDRQIEGAMTRVSTEGPVPIIRQSQIQDSPGGAANVARNIASLGGQVYLMGVVGDDENGKRLTQSVADDGIMACLPQTPSPTICKTRVTAAGVLVSRIDIEDPPYHADTALEASLPAVLHPETNVRLIVISDYGKGVMTPSLVRKVLAQSRELGIPVYVDCRPANLHLYHGVSLIKPNLKEAMEMLDDFGEVHPGLAVSDPVSLGDTMAGCLRRRSGAASVLLTMGSHGCIYYDPDDQRNHCCQTRARQVYDVCGAGDTVLAGISVGFLEGWNFSQSVRFAMSAAGLAVQERGVVAVARDAVDEVRYREAGWAGKLMDWSQLWRFSARRTRAGHRIVFTNGCFDGIHAGHIEMLRWAKQQGETLIVCYNDDQSLRQLKGETRPYVPESYRGSHLAQQDCVDAVYCFDGDVDKMIRVLSPDVLVKGEDTLEAGGKIPGADYLASRGGVVMFAPVKFNLSSSLAGTGSK